MGKKMMVWSLLFSGMTMFLMGNSSSSSSSSSSTSASSPNNISCRDEVVALTPCLTFLKGSPPPTPSVSCCMGAQKVFRQANTTQMRRNLCQCFGKASFDVDPAIAKLMPELCKIDADISFPIDPKHDCRITFEEMECSRWQS